jgi:hypothetical protein
MSLTTAQAFAEFLENITATEYQEKILPQGDSHGVGS